MPFLTRDNNVSLYYEVHGQGTPILLTHGYSSASAMWKSQVAPFTRAGCQLILWDMRGHGQTSYPEDPSAYTEAHTIADMAALLDHIVGSNQPAVIGGLSLGGYMTLAFHRMHPRRVKALLIIDTGPGFKSDRPREGWNRYAYSTAEKFEKEGLGSMQNESSERRLVKHRNAKGLALSARGMLTQHGPHVIDSLSGIKVPTLLVVGAEDKPFLPGMDYMERKIPGSKKVVVPGAGHAVNIDQPERFNEAVLRFLKEKGLAVGRSRL